MTTPRPLLRPDRRRLRVLHIGKFYPPYKGGMETHLQDLCQAISPYVDVEVIVSNTARNTVLDQDANIPVQRIGTWMNVASAPVCPGMVKAIRRTPADIVHLHIPNPTSIVSFFASRHPGRVVVTYQSDVIRQRVLKFAYEPWVRRLLSRADGIVCLSPNYIDSSPMLNAYRSKCHVISHGINPELFTRVDAVAVSQIRAKYGDRIVLAVGRLVYYKGFEHLIRAVAPTGASLLIIGTGPLREHLSQVAREVGAADRVHLLGEVADVLPYYHAARIFVLPSVARSEAFGIVQVEAMACGTPVVNTQLDSGVPYVSLDGVSGLTVPPADVPALQQAISRILDDSALHERFSSGARERVRQHFTIENMASQTLQLYRDIQENTSPGSSQAGSAVKSLHAV